MALLDDILGRLQALPPEKQKELAEEAARATAGMKWIPSPGPQTDAVLCAADQLLFGGQGGGGKSDTLLGLTFTHHKRSLIMRRKYTDLSALIERALAINGTRDGYNGSPPPSIRTKDGRLIEFGAAQHLGDEESWQGRPHDFLGLDEAVHFLEMQVRFLMGWVRSTDPDQRCRVMLASNPPMSAEGEWVIGMFRPWLDLTYPKPANPGELRWFVTDPDGKDLEVNGPDPVELGGRMLQPISRTFIPATLADNPFLNRSGYQAQLDALPEPLRSAVRDGNFMAARGDDEWQVIPTAWIAAAQARWKPDGHAGLQMTCMGVDPAGGGRDSEVIAYRYNGWCGELIETQGKETADGSTTASRIVKHRRNHCPVVVDVGGGYGGAVQMRLTDNEIKTIRHNGASESNRKTRDKALAFANKRAEVWWRMREELDPDQEGGSIIALPPDPELRADLAAPTWELRARGIQIESKEEIKKRLGRSPGKGDAVVMAYSDYARGIVYGGGPGAEQGGFAPRNNRHQTTAIMGHAATRR